MPLRESEAIILRSYSLGEADRLVSFLARAMGRVRGVARGARRTKSRFGASLEALTHVRIWFYERETQELVRISQCEVLESFLEAQGDFACAVAFGVIAEVSELILPEREASDPAFRLILAATRAIQRTRKPAMPLAYFCLWSVKLSGWLPEMAACSRCRTPLEKGAHASAVRPGFVCQGCRLPGMRAISGESMDLARRMLQTKLDDVMEQNAGRSPADLMAYLLDVIEHQAERKLKSRRMLESHS